MAAPNIVNVATINGESQGFELSTTLDASLMLVASNKLVKINRMQVANIDGSAAVDVTIQVTKATRTSAATGGSIAGDTLKGGASAASDATLFISYDVLDD